ncbi:hypothetical protein [Pectobacterium carotovorum]|nr:hypothetical protein [Pectobacterium carotovorum]
MNLLGLQDLREAIAEDIFLSEPETSGGIVVHFGMAIRYLNIYIMVSE